MSKDYKVGYGKPPKEHQWKPGQSGNPSGKKAKACPVAKTQTLTQYLVEELLSPISPTFHGKMMKMPTVQFLAKLILRDLLQAPAKERMQFLKQLASLGVLNGLETRIHEAQLAENDADRLDEQYRQAIKDVLDSLDLDDDDL